MCAFEKEQENQPTVSQSWIESLGMGWIESAWDPGHSSDGTLCDIHPQLPQPPNSIKNVSY